MEYVHEDRSGITPQQVIVPVVVLEILPRCSSQPAYGVPIRGRRQGAGQGVCEKLQ